jgi:hypothetical protein
MSLIFTCSSCGSKLRVMPEAAGKRAKCPKCGHVTELPAASSPPPATPKEISAEEAIHRRLTAIRAPAFSELFESKVVAMFPSHQLSGEQDGPFFIDVLVYPLEVEDVDGLVVVAVTNGMSDQRMAAGDDPDQLRRRELIQYLRECTPGHAKRLRDMAWIPLHDEFLLDSHHSIPWEWPAVEGTPWKNAFFLEPHFGPHQEFRLDLDGEEMGLLWHIPISDEERAFKKEHGSNALLDRMDQVDLPWLFEESNRPSMIAGKKPKGKEPPDKKK